MSSIKHKGFQKKKLEKAGEDKPKILTSTQLLFTKYQVELDTRYDKYERLLKKSRDLTIESKRIIFLLHRVDGSETDEEHLKEANDRLYALLLTIINDIGLELNKKEVYQHNKAFTNGLQEFVEALSFYYYLRNGKVITYEEVCNPDFLVQPTESSKEPDKKSELPLSAYLTHVEYVLGIADLTGELMRKCINSVGSGNLEEPFKLCLMLQTIYQYLLPCGHYLKELKRKLFTLKCSVQKVESACYAIKIRGSEVPRHMLADFFSTEKDTEFKGTESEF